MQTVRFAWGVSLINLILFHLPFFRFVFRNLDYVSINGMTIVLSLLILILVLNFFVFYILFSLSHTVGKFLLTLFFILNALSLYFVNTYSVIIDESMIGNVFNTNYEESSSFFSLKLILYILILGVLPSIFIIRTKLTNAPRKSFFKTILFSFLFIAIMVFANASNWLWIDKNSKSLGGLAMP